MQADIPCEKLVDETGIVLNSKQPSINGYGCWGLENYRGKTVRVQGIARKNVITEEMDQEMRNAGVAHKGPGVYWNIEVVHAVLLVE